MLAEITDAYNTLKDPLKEERMMMSAHHLQEKTIRIMKKAYCSFITQSPNPLKKIENL